MQFDSVADFLNMGGYAFYVWLSFGITFGAMALVVIQSYIKQKLLLKAVITEQARKARIKKARLQEAQDDKS
ncbi:heme exporter protein D [Alteromonas sp. KC3]|uniref:heme exporter protein CcmD n=1 Tax=unclassified Alteromonas TaxID=2614992 RepID=UPI0019243CC8|nr:MULTISPECIES: heme exporter protein CcmD [unclassified Alteromonas]BCO18043.1 heme exporter protein D [Alteromonas sp. KC3]BCO22004.1 heme exporter protein D [Alteromonas sp. KC14]